MNFLQNRGFEHDPVGWPTAGMFEPLGAELERDIFRVADFVKGLAA
ncbi:MAG: hypothetical protein AAGE94_14580 [Acidobacteriota bacterium]